MAQATANSNSGTREATRYEQREHPGTRSADGWFVWRTVSLRQLIRSVKQGQAYECANDQRIGGCTSLGQAADECRGFWSSGTKPSCKPARCPAYSLSSSSGRSYNDCSNASARARPRPIELPMENRGLKVE